MAQNKSPFEEAERVLSQGAQKETIYTDTELSRASALSQAVEKLQDLNNIYAVTDLSDHQIVLFQKAELLANFWDIPEIEDILRGLAIKRLSRDRKSRGEIIEVLAGLNRKKSILEKVGLKKTEGVE